MNIVRHDTCQTIATLGLQEGFSKSINPLQVIDVNLCQVQHCSNKQQMQ